MRIAFLTPEFVTEYRNGGGLGNYLARICHVLKERGHVPEVFVSGRESCRFDFDGILVHRVDIGPAVNRWKITAAVARWLPRGAYAAQCSAPIMGQAAALAKALYQREREVEFDFVQSADFQAVGLFVARRRNRPRIVRCSCAVDLYAEVDGPAQLNPWQCFWERQTIRRADRSYAPSQFVADHLQRKFGLPVEVVRPPLSVEVIAQKEPVTGLPARFHLHFGQLRRRKGSEFLADALPLVWQTEPEYRMVWAGKCEPELRELLPQKWGTLSDRVQFVGPLEKPALYGVLQRSQAAVLPSLVDNLPNTVIESLMFDRPVIGTNSSSIDELLTDGKNGLLVDYGDIGALSKAIIRVWRGEMASHTGLAAASPIWDEMQPDRAVDSLLRFATQKTRSAAASNREEIELARTLNKTVV